MSPAEQAELERAQEEAWRLRQEVEGGGGDGAPTDLAPLMPVETAVMRGLGPGGPHFEYITTTEPIIDKDTGRQARDKEGMALWKERRRKFRLGPFVSAVVPEAFQCLTQMDNVSHAICLAWAMQKGEGDLDPEKTLELMKKFAPKGLAEEMDLTGMAAFIFGSLREVPEQSVENCIDLCYLALQRYDPDIDRQMIADNCEYGWMLKLIGKMLYLTPSLGERFLP